LLVNVPDLTVQQAGLQTIDIGKVTIGPISVGDLVVTNTEFSMNAGHGVVKNMDIDVTLSLALEWWVGFDINKIVHVHEHHTTPLGSVHLNMPPVDVTLNSLSNIHVNIPRLTAQNLSVQANPVGLQLHNASADQIEAKNTSLPSAGFSIAGLMLASIQGNTVSIPAAKLDQATIGHLHGDPVNVAAFTLQNVNLPAAQAPTITNTAPLDVPTTLTLSNPPGFDAGLLKVVLRITASAVAHIPFLEISDVSANATVGQVELHNVGLPYDVLNLTLSQVGINTIGIPAFTVS
jgi:hypothetical protein